LGSARPIASTARPARIEWKGGQRRALRAVPTIGNRPRGHGARGQARMTVETTRRARLCPPYKGDPVSSGPAVAKRCLTTPPRVSRPQLASISLSKLASALAAHDPAQAGLLVENVKLLLPLRQSGGTPITLNTHYISKRWMFGRIFGLDGRELSQTAAGAVMLPSPSKPRNCSA
jgi:hypothetical protein